ncbi:dynein light chain Tctex-type protein 2B-like [Anopheles cruzii]|uniref:dynein light chain Tctex-type protein 2B-like n=1 Tax=Anopheles cruzii TaxID=68878 RepID=UPI0022EC693C|nr:dynein light chain Tctex-type protein 2B-like [Anopheles cruzii]
MVVGSEKPGEEMSETTQTQDDREGAEGMPAAYLMRPGLGERFKSEKIRDIINTALTETLTGKKYNAEMAAVYTKTLADEISLRVRDLNMQSYKHVVEVMLGQQLGAGCKYVSRCRWDPETDNHASGEFTNSSIFCVVTVFGLYLY